MSSVTSEPTAKTLRVAIIGYGLAGAVFHAPLITSTAGMMVAAIVTSNPERRAQACRDFPNAALLATADDIWHSPSSYDLVFVAAPNRLHVPFCIVAMNS